MATRLGAHRVEVVAGCLAAPRLGLDAAAWADLAARRPVVVHSGAWVDWVRPYAALRDANVGGTAELLRLCLSGEPPLSLLHVSTGAVAGLGAVADCEAGSSDADHAAELAGASGYAASKAVAEALVRCAAQTRGLNAVVLRPGTVGPDSRTGRLNPADFTARYLAACVQLGVAADAPALCEQIPVDFVAAACVACVKLLLAPKPPPPCPAGPAGRSAAASASAGAPSPLTFAVSNPRSPTFAELALLIRAHAAVAALPPRAFVRAVAAAAHGRCRLQPLLPVMDDAGFWAAEGEEVDPCGTLWQVLAVHAPELAMPAVDAAYVGRALRWLRDHDS